MQPISSALINRDFRPISGWNLLTFVVLAPAGAFGAILLLRGLLLSDRGQLIAMGVVYAVGLLAVVIAVAPLGRAAGPALALRGALRLGRRCGLGAQ